MLRIDQLKAHRSWEDWIIFSLGATLIVSPAFDPRHTSLALLNAIVIGFLVLCLALSELSLMERWDERATLMFGVWMIVSPFMLGYFQDGSLWYWHTALGAGLAIMAALELWQENGTSSRHA